MKKGGISQDALNTFVDHLVSQKGLGNLAPEVLEQMKRDLVERVEQHVNASVVAALPPEKLEEFDQLLEKESADKIQKFCEQNIPHLQDVVAATLVKFEATYLNP